MDTAKEITLLAIESSGRTGGVAVLHGSAVLAEAQVAAGERSAAVLTPLVQKALAEAGKGLVELNVVAVTSGPGSFTGLRVGVTTAKTLAYALGCDVLAVNTLDLIAAQVPGEVQSAWVILDAQRQQLFAAKYRRDANAQMTSQEGTAIIDNDSFLAGLADGDCVAGPAVGKLRAQLPAGVCIAPEDCWQPRAITVGQLAMQRYVECQRDDLWKLAPQYFRQSAAEEKLQDGGSA